MQLARAKTRGVTGKTAARGVLLYDERCVLCRTCVLRLDNVLRDHGFEIAPLESPWVSRRLNLPDKELLTDVRLLLPDGRQVVGADAYRYIMGHIGWLYPLYLLSLAGPMRRIFDAAYRAIAARRRCIPCRT
jgi:predicted DCC family thiol-disulfide oxidoreductase YuxK